MLCNKIFYKLFLILCFLLFPLNSFGYQYYNSCGSYSGTQCYDSITYSCNEKYPSNVLDAQTQYNRMGCIADSMSKILPGWDNRLLNHYILRKSYFAAAINKEIPFYKALEMSNNAMNQYNSSLNNNYNNNSARQRCLSNCLINNSSGSGFGGALNGLAACNQQCP